MMSTSIHNVHILLNIPATGQSSVHFIHRDIFADIAAAVLRSISTLYYTESNKMRTEQYSELFHALLINVY
jgi:hypothetical protein